MSQKKKKERTMMPLSCQTLCIHTDVIGVEWSEMVIKVDTPSLKMRACEYHFFSSLIVKNSHVKTTLCYDNLTE